MKRISAIAVCIGLVVTLFGCGRRVLRPVPPALPDSFVCSLSLTSATLRIEADWTLTPGESVFAVHAPQELSDVTVRCTADGATMTLDGVEAPLPDTSPFVRLTDAYRALLSASPEAIETAQGWLYDCKQTEGFTVLQSAENGLPTRISIPQYEITGVINRNLSR